MGYETHTVAYKKNIIFLVALTSKGNLFLKLLNFPATFMIFWDNYKLSFTWYAFEDTHIGF
jgi:hypothetical protein